MSSELESGATLPEPGERPDAELLNAYVQGDEPAFELLVKRYFGLLHAISLRRLRDPSLAEEATQSVFIILAHKAKTLAGGVVLRAWLMKTARYVCNDVLKSQRRRHTREQALEPCHAELTAANGEGGPARELVEQALLSLPATEQTCLIARFYEGRNFKELARILGISERGAQKKVSRSLDKLRVYLSRRGVRLSDAVLSGWLVMYRVPPVPADLVDASIRVIVGAAHGKAATSSAVGLAARCLRLLRRRDWLILAAKVVPVTLFVGVGGWLSWSSARAVGLKDSQMEKLGKAWSAVVLRAADAKQTFKIAPTPGTPQFLAYMREMMFAVNETARIQRQIEAALKPPADREKMAEFLTVEMRETLALDHAQRTAIFNYILLGLSNGATLKQAMQAMAQSTPTEAGEIKAFLSDKQREVFDRVYGADGLCLFQYCKVGAG
jgi:RNA polymerase sigma factor (sigma-70 family)